MITIPPEVLSYLQLFGYIATVIYFVRSTKAVKRSKLQAEIDQINTIDKLVKAVDALMTLHKLEVEQRKASDTYAQETRMKVRLMLQQHKANHNQNIEGE